MPIIQERKGKDIASIIEVQFSTDIKTTRL